MPSNPCPSHSRLREDVETLRDKLENIREKVSKISGWQVAISVFISICVALILDASSATRDSVKTLSTYYQELAKEQNELDKRLSKVSVLDSSFQESVDKQLNNISSRVTSIEQTLRESGNTNGGS